MTAVIDRLRFIDNRPTYRGNGPPFKSLFISTFKYTFDNYDKPDCRSHVHRFNVHTFSAQRSALTNLIRTRCVLVLVPYRSRLRHAFLVFCP
jgi:hypothetical protein